MTGSILQLVAIGIDTVYLTGDPSITHFKIVYRRHTNFTLTNSTEKIQNLTKFDSDGRFKIPKKGDCVTNCYLQFEIGNFNVKYPEPTSKNISKLLEEFSITGWVSPYDDSFIITPSIYNNSIKPIIYDNIENYVTLNNFYIRFIDDIKKGIRFYHEESDSIYNSILKKINRIYNNSSFYSDRNYVYLLLDQLKKYLADPNYNENFIYVDDNIITDISGVYSGDICGNILSIINDTYVDTSKNIIYQGDYIDWLFEFGYGMFTLDSSGNYIRDASGERVQKIYLTDSSGNYIYDSSGNKQGLTSNLTPNTQLLSRMFDIIKCYNNEVTDLSGITFVEPIYIRDRMYDAYLNNICDYSGTNINNYLTINQCEDTRYIYNLYILLSENRTPTVINFLDKNIDDYYDSILRKIYNNSSYIYLYPHSTDASGTLYTRFDSYKLMKKFSSELEDNNIYDESSITKVQPTMLTAINDNIRVNYKIFTDILDTIIYNFRFIAPQYFFRPHIRIGSYYSYTGVSNNYLQDQSLFTNVSPSSYNLNDGFLDVYNKDTTFLIYYKNYFREYILNSYNSLLDNLNNTINYEIFGDYFKDKTLWDFLIINQSPMKDLLQSLTIDGSGVYTRLQNELVPDALDKLAILNLIPTFLVYEIPLAVNRNMELLDISSTTISALDLSSNTFTFGSFDKAVLYDTILRNTIMDAQTYTSYGITITNYVVDSDLINAYTTNNLQGADKFALFRLIRPEKKYQFYNDNDGKTYYLPNTRAIIEEYRKVYYDIVDTVSETPEKKQEIFLLIDRILLNYSIFDINCVFEPSLSDFGFNNIPISQLQTYTSYTQNYQYRYVIVDFYNTPPTLITYSTPEDNSVTKFKFAQGSIYGYLEKNAFTNLNKVFNDILLNNDYYENTLGLSMHDLYNFFINYVTSITPTVASYFSTYIKVFSKTVTPDMYPVIGVGSYDVSFGSGPQIFISHNVYNSYYSTSTLFTTNINVPIGDGIDYNDFQVLIDASGSPPVNINGSIAIETIGMSDSFQNLIDTYNNSYTNTYAGYPILFIYNSYKEPVEFNTVENIIDYYNSIISIDISASIIVNTKIDLSNNYIVIGNQIFSMYNQSYTTNNGLKANSLKDIFYAFTLGSNPFDASGTPLLYECYDLHFSYGNQMYNKYLNITDNIVNSYIYNNKYRNTLLYNNFENKLDLIKFFKKHLIFNTDGKSDAKYLLRFEDPTITEYENIILQHLNNLKSTYFDIIKNILYSSTPLSSTEQIYYLNQRYSAFFPIQSLLGNTNIFEGSQLEIIIKSMTSNIPAEYSWVKELGLYLCEYVNLEINKDVIDSYNSHLMSLKRKLYGTSTKLRGFDYLIGNRKELYTYNNSNKSNILITLPLYFWFCKDAFNALPMTNILYSDVEITFRIRKLLDLLKLAPYSSIDKTPRFRCKVLMHYVYLEMEERLRIAASKLEFLVETNHTSGLYIYKYKDIINKQINSRLYFSGPCKYLLWRAKIKNNDKVNWNKDGYTVTTQKIVTTTIDTLSPPQSFDIYYNYETEIKIINYTEIYFNGNVRQEFNSDYFNTITTYEANMGALEDSQFMYSFALFPKLLQPSGAANLSMIEDLTFTHTLTDEIIEYMKNNDLTLEIEYWNLDYQVMRVMSGFIAPAFVYTK